MAGIVGHRGQAVAIDDEIAAQRVASEGRFECTGVSGVSDACWTGALAALPAK